MLAVFVAQQRRSCTEYSCACISFGAFVHLCSRNAVILYFYVRESTQNRASFLRPSCDSDWTARIHMKLLQSSREIHVFRWGLFLGRLLYRCMCILSSVSSYYPSRHMTLTHQPVVWCSAPDQFVLWVAWEAHSIDMLLVWKKSIFPN
jgi:hypothetical protein